jgi:hypothetical protein
MPSSISDYNCQPMTFPAVKIGKLKNDILPTLAKTNKKRL